MLATNLTNSRKLSKTLVANITVSGRAFGESNLHVETKLDPSTDRPTFDLNFKMEPVALIKLNDFARAYGKFDFEKGTLAAAAELACADGKLDGYLMPIFDNIAVVNLKEDAKNPLQLVGESAVGGVLRLFRNQPRDRFATKIPITGTFSNPKLPVLPALGNIVKNEFVRAFQGDVENIINLEDAASSAEEKPKERTKGSSTSPSRIPPVSGKR